MLACLPPALQAKVSFNSPKTKRHGQKKNFGSPENATVVSIAPSKSAVNGFKKLRNSPKVESDWSKILKSDRNKRKFGQSQLRSARACGLVAAMGRSLAVSRGSILGVYPVSI
jgi:hypothetical protein